MKLPEISSDKQMQANQSISSRIIPIIIFFVFIAGVIYIPARIGSLGYTPTDDALRHTAKVVSGKNWDQILVLRDNIEFDSHPGWHILLEILHKNFRI